MYDLTNRKVVYSLCDEFGFRFKKAFGQNFLTDASVLRAIAEAAGEHGVLEIGPGFGTLTGYLAENAEKVVAVELDRALFPVLEKTLGEYDNVSIREGDVMKIDLPALLKEEFDGQEVSVAANLPYYITTPIITRLLEEKLPIRALVLMMQKEVADRILADPGTKDYGALSLFVRYYADASLLVSVPKESFVPAPKVDSAVLVLMRREVPPVSPIDEKLFFGLIRAGFAQRRKTFVNAASSAGLPGVTKEGVAKALCALEIDEKVRGEVLSIEQYCEIANFLLKN